DHHGACGHRSRKERTSSSRDRGGCVARRREESDGGEASGRRGVAQSEAPVAGGQPSVARLGKSFANHCDRTVKRSVRSRSPTRIRSTPEAISTARICFLIRAEAAKNQFTASPEITNGIPRPAE